MNRSQITDKPNLTAGMITGEYIEPSYRNLTFSTICQRLIDEVLIINVRN